MMTGSIERGKGSVERGNFKSGN